MVEILGDNLKRFFDVIDKNCEDADITYAGNHCEVWQVSDDLFKKMCDMSEEKFVEIAGEDAWWRSAEGSVMDAPDTEFIINGEEMIGWNYRNKYENFQYENLSDYLCYGVGASQPRNVCALAVDLAKYNNMTMSELFNKYEG